jgi:hypothetical protein
MSTNKRMRACKRAIQSTRAAKFYGRPVKDAKLCSQIGLTIRPKPKINDKR